MGRLRHDRFSATVGKLFLLTLLCIAIVIIAVLASPQAVAGEERAADFATPNWIEPRGISVVDVVGLIPESHLRDLILVYVGDQGVVQYVSGERNGDTVTITVKNDFFEPNVISCFGWSGRFDEFPAVVPASTMRVFSNGSDVTDRVNLDFEYYPAGLIKPTNGAHDNRRYVEQTGTARRDAQGNIVVPANMGCEFTVGGSTLSNVTVQFQFDSPVRIKITTVGELHGKKYSWIGPSSESFAAGILSSLNTQLLDFNEKYAESAQYPDIGRLPPWGRTDGFNVSSADYGDADFVLHKYPPLPVNAYLPEYMSGEVDPMDNLVAGGGSWRINSGKDNYYPSVDHTTGQLYPLHGNWKDGSGKPGSKYLTHFSKASILTIPEYILPPGVDYHPCMTEGGCSNALLAEIFRTQFQLDSYFYEVERISDDLKQIPLKAVGGLYGASRTAEALAAMEYSIYLPAIVKPITIPPDNTVLDCPCGWFDEIGRLYDYVD